MTILEPRLKPAHYLRQSPSPKTSMVASFLLPGLGQFMSGERRKGAFFFVAHSVNLSLIALLILAHPLTEGLKFWGDQYHMRLNQSLGRLLANIGPVSPLACILATLFLSFALFAARDAFVQSIKLRRAKIYHDNVLAMPEAASGSYIFHCSFLLACIIPALFFLLPAPPLSQIVDIEFRANQETTQEKQVTKKHAAHNAKAAGRHDPTRPSESLSDTSKADTRPANGSEALSTTKSTSSSSAQTPRSSLPRPSQPPHPGPLPRIAAMPAPSLELTPLL